MQLLGFNTNNGHCPVKAMPPHRWPLLHQPNSASPMVLLPDELIIEILSWLPVKSLMTFRCLNKFIKTTISKPCFVQMHLKKSSRNSHLAQFCRPELKSRYGSLVTLPIPGLLQKNITILHHIPFPLYPLKFRLYKGQVIGSCNGLLCFIGYSDTHHSECLCFWNPAMGTNSTKFSIFTNGLHILKYSFGYDNSSGTYKVVAFYTEVKHGFNPKNVVKVFNLGGNSWRDIQCFPVLPIYWFCCDKNNGVYLNGSINWLALRNYFRSSYGFGWFKGVNVEQYVIVSLNLSTESYTLIPLPCGFDEVPHFPPSIMVLMNCLCFGHDFGKKHFVIWHMKDFGVQESWVQLFKIGYHHLYTSSLSIAYLFELQPLYVFENGHRLIFTENEMGSVYVYNCIDDRVERIPITYDKHWLLWVTDYIESLVPIS